MRMLIENTWSYTTSLYILSINLDARPGCALLPHSVYYAYRYVSVHRMNMSQRRASLKEPLRTQRIHPTVNRQVQK